MSPKPRTSKHGLVVYYFGNGKGKTTAAVGVAVRAVGWGWKVLFLQFFKSTQWSSGERKALEKLGVDVKVLGEGFVGILGDRKPKAQHIAAAKRALESARKAFASGRYQLVVLDEIISCVEVGLLTVGEVMSLLRRKPKNLHVVLTGHQRYAKLVSLADTVTDMRMVKHPYNKGQIAQRGIDY